ncbi:class I adenylate-forming enzyme family protein [Nesterenkonia sphaerica]|nr:AMP-binding protein [Nesterenkonia sphaerica]
MRAETLTEAWAHRVRDEPDGSTIEYLDLNWNATQVNDLANALAVCFQTKGVGYGDRVGVQLQNVPQFALCMLALWKLGAVPLILNTMYGAHELTIILNDASPVGLVSSETSVEEVTKLDLDGPTPWVLCTDDHDLAQLKRQHHEATPSEEGLVRSLLPHLGSVPEPVRVTGDDAALLTYTSGTTGSPKGAVGSHTNLLSVGYGVQQWLDVCPGEGVLAVAPLFHITGAVATAAMALTVGRAPLIFVGRVRPDSMLCGLRNHSVHHILGSITVYNALLDSPEPRIEDFSGLKSVYSGGAPVPPATVKKFEDRFGHYIHNVYGMTETASAVIGVPLGRRAPVDELSGSLSIGVPLPGLLARVVDPHGHEVETGTMGELVLSGPQCTQEYLNKADATAETIRDGWLHTGDVALLDADGWVYLIDRQKDQINVSGYKVWPREVEDVIYEHSAVREVAVVGLSDDYSGERVVAFVSLQAGKSLTPAEVTSMVRERLAAFKVPKDVFVIDELPKTPTGKIQRRVLRNSHRNVRPRKD